MIRTLPIALAAPGLCAVAASIWLAYAAGCVGDVQDGAWGDVNRASELEGVAMPLVFSGTVALIAYARFRHEARGWVCFVAFALAVSMGYSGMLHSELSGTAQCNRT